MIGVKFISKVVFLFWCNYFLTIIVFNELYKKLKHFYILDNNVCFIKTDTHLLLYTVANETDVT